jgi:hypothetical protein
MMEKVIKKPAVYLENGGVLYDPELADESELKEEYEPED